MSTVPAYAELCERILNQVPPEQDSQESPSNFPADQPDFPPLLDTIETTARIKDDGSFRAFSARSCKDEIEAAGQMYIDIDHRDGMHRYRNFDECRWWTFFMRHEETGLLRVSTSHCGLRWCPLCSTARRYFIAKQAKEWLEAKRYPKFFSLTMKHNDDSLSEQIDKLYTSFRRLRTRVYLKKSIPGGIWFFQIKKSKSDGRWHPHLHCLIHGKYLKKSKLQRMWHQTTGDSYIIDIRPIKDKSTVAEYVARYAACPAMLEDYSTDERMEVFDAMHGRRICGTWGTGRQCSLRPEKPDDGDKWHRFGSWEAVSTMSKVADIEENAFKCFLQNKPVPATNYFLNLERNADEAITAEIEKPPLPIQLQFFETNIRRHD